MTNLDKIKKIREQTGFSVMQIKNALEEAGGDEGKTLEILKKKSFDKARTKSERQTSQGLIETYIHLDGRVGVILELNCETDFVVKNREFKQLAHEVVLQVAFQNPKNVEELLSSIYIRDENMKISDLVTEKINKFGENIVIKRFQRYGLGEK